MRTTRDISTSGRVEDVEEEEEEDEEEGEKGESSMGGIILIII